MFKFIKKMLRDERGFMGVAEGALIVGGLAAAGSIGAAYIGSQGQKDAAATQAAAANNATQVQWNEFLQQQENQKPFLEAGTTAINQLSTGLQPGGQFTQTPAVFTPPTLDQLQMDPGYAWRRQQGIDAITAAGAAGGTLGSGRLGTALINYGQGAASEEYQNAFQRYMNMQNTIYNQTNQNQATNFNRLASIAGVGQTAVGQLGQAGQNAANNVSNIGMNAANNIAATQINSANAWAGAINNTTNAFTSGLTNYANQQQQNQLIGSMGGYY